MIARNFLLDKTIVDIFARSDQIFANLQKLIGWDNLDSIFAHVLLNKNQLLSSYNYGTCISLSLFLINDVHCCCIFIGSVLFCLLGYHHHLNQDCNCFTSVMSVQVQIHTRELYTVCWQVVILMITIHMCC